MDGVRLLVRDLNAELLSRHQYFSLEGVHSSTHLLNCHHNFHGVQAVQAEVVGEVSSRRELVKVLEGV